MPRTLPYPAAMFSPRGNVSKPAAEALSPRPPRPSEEAWEKVSDWAMSSEWDAAAEARAFPASAADGDDEEEEEEETFFKGEEPLENINGPLFGDKAEALQEL